MFKVLLLSPESAAAPRWGAAVGYVPRQGLGHDIEADLRRLRGLTLVSTLMFTEAAPPRRAPCCC
jgi:hypothetical protein